MNILARTDSSRAENYCWINKSVKSKVASIYKSMEASYETLDR